MVVTHHVGITQIRAQWPTCISSNYAFSTRSCQLRCIVVDLQIQILNVLGVMCNLDEARSWC